MNKVLIILLTVLGSCFGLSAMESKTKKSKTEIDGDLRLVTAFIAQLKEAIPTEVGNEIAQYIVARSGVVPFISPKIAPVPTSMEDIPQEKWTSEFTKKDLLVLRPGKAVTILSGKTGNRIQTLPEASTEECEQRQHELYREDQRLISSRGKYKIAKLSPAGDKMVTVSTFDTTTSTYPELRKVSHHNHGSVFAHLWCMRTGSCLHTLIGHTDDIESAKFDESGLKIITASKDGSAKIWSVATGECLITIPVHLDGIPLISARLNKAGDKAATASGEGLAKVWDLETGECLATFEHNDAVHTVRFIGAGDLFVTVTTDDIVTIWSLELPERVLRRFSLPAVNGVKTSLSKDGNTLLAYGDGRRVDLTAVIYSFVTRTWKRLNYEIIWFAAFNEAGDKVITVSAAVIVRIWSTATGECIRTIKCPGDAIDFAAIDQNDERIATYCSHNNRIKVWSLSTGRCLYAIEGKLSKHHGSPFTSQKDALITTSCGSSPISLWDLSYFQRMSNCLTLEQGFLLKALYEVAFLRKLIENRLNKGLRVLDNQGNPVTSVQQIVYDFEKNPDLLKAYTELDEPVKKVLNPYVVNHVMAPRSHALSSHSSMQILD